MTSYFRVPLIRVPYYTGDVKKDLNLNVARRPPRPGRKQRGPTNCWCQFTAAHRWDERQKSKEKGARKNWTAEERDEAKKTIKVESRQKLEFENGQEMKTNGPVLCVEDLGLAEHRRLPLSASASKNNKQEWRKSGSNN